MYVFCLLGQTVLTAGVGVGVILATNNAHQDQPVALAIGIGDYCVRDGGDLLYAIGRDPFATRRQTGTHGQIRYRTRDPLEDDIGLKAFRTKHILEACTPSLEEFRKLAAQGNVVPVTRRLLADIETPLSAYRKIRGPGESFLFESVEGGEHLGRYSFVGCNPRAVVRQTGSTVEVLANGKVVESFTVVPLKSAENGHGGESGKGVVRDGLEVVQRVMKQYHPVAVPGLPRFTGGAVGFIGYEFIHDVEPVVPRPPRDDLQTPVMYFIVADQLLIFDRVAQTLTVLVNAVLEDAATPEEAYENAIGEIERLVSLLEQPSEHVPVSVPENACSPI